MSDVQVRPFRRGDRDRLTMLVNAHAGAVVPGMSVSVNTVLGSLERQPGGFITDPWVSERVTLVAEQLAVRRSVGINGCRLSAVLGAEVIGYIEIEILDEGERMWRHGGWADVGNLRVAAPYRRRGVGSWLLGQAAGWLRLAQVTRLLDYAWLDGTDPAGQSYDDYRAFLPAAGFRELTRTARGWTKSGDRPAAGPCGT